MPYVLTALTALITGLVTSVVVVIVVRLLDRLRQRDAETKSREILERAEKDAASKVREADLEIKERTLRQKTAAEEELHKIREDLRERERLLDKRQETVVQQTDDLRKQEKIAEATQRKSKERLEETARKQEELNKLIESERQTLHQISGLDREEATQRLMNRLEEELSGEVGTRIAKHERRVTELCDERARDILLTALHRYAAAHTAESTTSTVDIPSDEMKGRIIGREGRNIRELGH